MTTGRMARRIIYLISYWLNGLGLYALIALVLVVIARVVLRKLSVPVTGIFQAALVIAFILYLCTWTHAQVEKGHVRVHIFVSRLPVRVQSLIDSITYVLSLGFCFLLSWWSICYAYALQVGGEIVAPFLPIPEFLLASMLAFTCMLLGVVILIDLLDSVTGIVKKK